MQGSPSSIQAPFFCIFLKRKPSFEGEEKKTSHSLCLEEHDNQTPKRVFPRSNFWWELLLTKYVPSSSDFLKQNVITLWGTSLRNLPAFQVGSATQVSGCGGFPGPLTLCYTQPWWIFTQHIHPSFTLLPFTPTKPTSYRLVQEKSNALCSSVGY